MFDHTRLLCGLRPACLESTIANPVKSQLAVVTVITTRFVPINGHARQLRQASLLISWAVRVAERCGRT